MDIPVDLSFLVREPARISLLVIIPGMPFVDTAKAGIREVSLLPDSAFDGMA